MKQLINDKGEVVGYIDNEGNVVLLDEPVPIKVAPERIKLFDDDNESKAKDDENPYDLD